MTDEANSTESTPRPETLSGEILEHAELRDLGGGQWLGTYKDRSILFTEREGALWSTIGQLAGWAGLERKQGPGELAKIGMTALDDGLIETSDLPESVRARLGKNTLPYKDWPITRKAALLLMTRCRTPQAIELTRAVYDLVDQWLDRRHPHSWIAASLALELKQSQQELLSLQREIREQVVRLAQRPSGLPSSVPLTTEGEILGHSASERGIVAPLQAYVDKMCAAHPAIPRRSHAASAHRELRDHLSFSTAAGGRWKFLPKDRLKEAQEKLKQMHARVDQALEQKRKERSQDHEAKQACFDFEKAPSGCDPIH